jgi:hypothetical protein
VDCGPLEKEEGRRKKGKRKKGERRRKKGEVRMWTVGGGKGEKKTENGKRENP